MLRNDNQEIIRRLAGHSLKNNHRRTLIMGLAVVLSSFMLFSVFTVGITYFNMLRLQNIRLGGSEEDAVMYGMTEEQKEKLEANPDIEKIGIAAVSGYVESTDRDDTINVGLMWADETYWEEMMAPARKYVKGAYPKEKNEIMVTKAALKECGYEELSVGDTFVMTWGDAQWQPHTEEFEISGIWEGYGTKKVFYVSEEFYQNSGYELSEVSSGRYFIDFKQRFISEKEQKAVIEGMNLEKQQNIFFSVTAAESIPVFLGLCGIALCTCLCAYLLIYNILYLAVSGNVRYYGLLQTVGMTGRQMKSLIRRQMLLVGGAGTAGGICLGILVSFFIIPSVVRFLGVRAKGIGEIEISFHPAVFLITVALSALTIYMGSRKPVRMAESISPVEAASYRSSGGRKDTRRSKDGNLLKKMAWNQITGDRKRSAVIIFSMGMGLSIFLCLVTMIHSQGPRTFVSNYMNMDITVENDTLKKESHDDWVQLMDGAFLEDIRKSAGVGEVNPVHVMEIMIPWEPDFADTWMREEFAMWMWEPYEGKYEQEYKEHPENFGTFLVGINERDFDFLNENLENPVDKEAFEAGRICILYRNGLEFETEDLAGKEVTCAVYGDREMTCTFEIAGLTDESYYSGPMLGFPPAVIVSDKTLETFSQEAFAQGAGNALTYVSKFSARYDESYDAETEEAVLSCIEKSPHANDFSYSSKIQELKNVEAAQGNMMEVGIGVALILAFIGILNYINTVVGNIQNRQMELAILESVGMTQKQMNRMLVLEGVFFAAGSLAFTGTVGLGITYVVYQSMNYMGAGFMVPILPVIFMILFILGVCIVIPVVSRYVVTKNGSVVERIRGITHLPV